MAFTESPKTNEPITQWSAVPENSHQPHPHLHSLEADSTDPTESHCPHGTEPRGAWETRIVWCCSSPLHLLAAVLLPCMSGAYTARSIGKFPVALGVLLAVFYYGAITFAVLQVLDDSQPSVTLVGIELKIWQSGVGWALMHFLGSIVLLRGWTRTFYNIPGSLVGDLAVSCLLPFCALAQMSLHTARAKQQQRAHKTTLQAYAP